VLARSSFFAIDKMLRAIAVQTASHGLHYTGRSMAPVVQDLHYGETRKDTPGFAVFDIAIDEEMATPGYPRDNCEKSVWTSI